MVQAGGGGVLYEECQVCFLTAEIRALTAELAVQRPELETVIDGLHALYQVVREFAPGARHTLKVSSIGIHHPLDPKVGKENHRQQCNTQP